MPNGLVLLALAMASFPGDPANAPHTAHAFLAEGRSGLVVGLTGQRSVDVGLGILKQGGSAVDAAMATSLSQVVEAAGSYISFAGILSMMYFDASTGRVEFLNACFNTPREEKDPLSIPKLDPFAGGAAPSGRAVLVPGFMAGVGAAHARFGKLPLARLFEPAIQLAEEGFVIDASLAGNLQFRKDVLSRLPETRRVFTKENGKLYERGDLFRQPDLAATLHTVAARGTSSLYSGDWAERFVAAVRKDGGVLTPRDLESYKVLWEEPLETTYGDAQVHAPGPSSHGGVDTLEALNLLELAGLKQRGLPTESSESLFWLIQITRNQEVSYARELATSRFPDRDLSPQARVSKASARWVWERMQVGEWPLAVKPVKASNNRIDHSSGVVAVDRWGNVAAVTHTIYTALWGKTGIFVGGISIPDSGSFQQEAMKEVGPGKRLPEGMSPLIITRNGKPVLASTVIGGGIHQRNVQVLAGFLEFGINAQSSVDAPAFLLPAWEGTRSIARVSKGAFDSKVLEGVRLLGQEVQQLSPQERAAYIGYWAGIQIDPRTGLLQAAGTAELPSYAKGY
jgi:gamma-glutamyltranspeptidase / glutathione hydrolase